VINNDPLGLADKDQILAAFRYLYGEIGQQLLESFLKSNSSYGPGQLKFGPDSDWWTTSGISGGHAFPTAIPYKIGVATQFSHAGAEYDVPAPIAAIQLYSLLMDMMGRDNCMRNYWLGHFMPGGATQSDDALWAEYQVQVRRNFATAASTAATLACAYVRGITLINEPAMVAVSIGDIADGDYTAALNLIPLAATIASKVGGKIMAKFGGEAVEVDAGLAWCLAHEGCFATGTLVATETGQRPIETIGIGDRVWAYDVQAGQWSLQDVTIPITIDYVGKLISVTTPHGVLRCTPTHPFWVVEGPKLSERPSPTDVPINEQIAFSTGRWVAAGDLLLGDALLTKDGAVVRVDDVVAEIVNCRVHNLIVSHHHTFAVGGERVLVHNLNPACKQAVLARIDQARANGMTIRNLALAGKTHPVTGIPFDAQGFPDFSGVSIKNVEIRQAGNYTTDFVDANRAAGFSNTPSRYIWHHHQNGTTMQLVPFDIHNATGHTGGVSIIKRGG
jgi:hypothetical protein